MGKYDEFDDEETWNLDIGFAEFVLPRLRRFKILTNGYPDWDGLNEVGWDDTLDKIIECFALLADKENRSMSFTYTDEDHETIKVGLELFTKYYQDLWW